MKIDVVIVYIYGDFIRVEMFYKAAMKWVDNDLRFLHRTYSKDSKTLYILILSGDLIELLKEDYMPQILVSKIHTLLYFLIIKHICYPYNFISYNI